MSRSLYNLSVLGAAFLFSAASFPLHSQPLATCNDLELVTGTFTPVWKAYYGKWHENNSLCTIIYDSNNSGFLNWRHQVKTPADGNVPCFGGGNIPYTPPGFDYSIQLGNWDDNREWERLETTIEVNNDNSLIEINLAVFLEDKGHNSCRQPRFWVRVFDATGNLVQCGDYQVIATGNLPGWGT